LSILLTGDQSLHGFSDDDIAKVQEALNQKHRMTLGYANAAELIEAALAS
jgi:IS30 family transposase